ncbi:hypothetical protein D3C75_1069680 [compost metagenome]
MVGTDHQTCAGAGDGVLGDHPGACLDVAHHEVHQRRRAVLQRRHFSCQCAHCRGDIHRVNFICLDHVQACLGVMLVMLYLVRQAHGNEGVGLVAGFGAQLVDGTLGEQGGSQ